MKILLSVLLFCAAIIGTTTLSLYLVGSDPSTEALDEDIRLVEQQIAEISEDMSSYSEGAILGIYQARHEILATAHDMLKVKRSSLIRRINLTYTVNGTTHVPSQERLEMLAADIQRATADRDAAQEEADRYSAGLIKTVALMQVATAELAISQLRLSELAETYGFLLRLPGTMQSSQPVGQNIVEEEGDAL